MNKFYSFILLAVSMVVSFFIIQKIVLADYRDGWRIDNNTINTPIASIDSLSNLVCHLITNNSSSNYFIPTRTKVEWDAFAASTPSGVTISGCICPASTINDYSYPDINYGASTTGTKTISGGSCSATVSCSSTGVVTMGTGSCTCTSGYYNSTTGACTACLTDSNCASGYYCQGASTFNYCNSSATAYTCQRKCWSFIESTAILLFWEADTVSTSACSATYRDNPKCLDGHPNATPTCPSSCNDVRENLGTPNSNESCCEYYNAFGCGDWDARVRYRCSERATYTRYYNDSCRRSLTSTSINGRVDASGICNYYCGDGICTSSTGETCSNCTSDCGYCTVGYCGDNICNYGEDYDYCPSDCGYSYNNSGYCGDDYCDISNDPYENSSYCPEDCGYLDFCGNGTCEPAEGEDHYTCPDDCY